MSTKKSDAMKFLSKITGGPVTFGKLLEAIRLGEEMTQPEFAKKLKVSKSHINDIEKGRKTVSPERAAKFAKILGYSEDRFVELTLQSMLDQVGLHLKVEVKTAS
jgi:transcriptional regulator with XRE-family HTH domain